MTKEGAPAPLLELIRTHHDRLTDVRLDYLKGRDYVTTRMSVGVQRVEELEQLEHAKVGEDDYDEPPEEIAAAVFDLAVEHATGSGAKKYRAMVWGNKGEKYCELDRVIFVVAIDYDTGDARGEEAPPDAASTLELAHKIAKSEHSKHMTTIDRFVPVLGEMVKMAQQMSEMAGPMAQAKVDLAKIEFEREEMRQDSEDRQHAWNASVGFLSKLADVFGVQIAKAWKDAGMPGTPPKPPKPGDGVEQLGNLVMRWDEMFQKIEPAKLSDLSDLLGEDLAKLAEKMRTAEDDLVFKNMAVELFSRAQQDPQWVAKLVKIKGLLGEELGDEFAKVLAEANL